MCMDMYENVLFFLLFDVIRSSMTPPPPRAFATSDLSCEGKVSFKVRLNVQHLLSFHTPLEHLAEGKT